MGLRAILVVGLFVVALGCASTTPPPCAPTQTAPGQGASNAPPGASASVARAGPAAAKPEDLTALIVPIYVRNYRRETIIAAIRFYESEQGRLLVEKMPAVTKETGDAGREWGKQLAARTLRELGAVPSKSP